MSDCRHPRIRILNSTVPIDAVKCFFNPPRVPARVSVTVKNDLVPKLIMPRLIWRVQKRLEVEVRESGMSLSCSLSHYREDLSNFNTRIIHGMQELWAPEACYCVATNYPGAR